MSNLYVDVFEENANRPLPIRRKYGTGCELPEKITEEIVWLNGFTPGSIDFYRVGNMVYFSAWINGNMTATKSWHEIARLPDAYCNKGEMSANVFAMTPNRNFVGVSFNTSIGIYPLTSENTHFFVTACWPINLPD